MRRESAFVVDPALPRPLQEALDHALAAPHKRVQRVAAGGRAVWLKQAETLTLRWRLQKGDPRRALEAERAGLHDLGSMGLPVARLVAEGPDFLATAEAGVPLSQMLADPAQAGPGRVAAFAAAGAALAALHRAGVVHGRPAVRDICWDGRQARFIDFERYRRGKAGRGRMAREVLVLLHAVLSIRPDPGPELTAALEGWQAGVPADLVAELHRQAGRLRWLRGPLRLVQRLRPTSRELRAALALLDWPGLHPVSP